MSRRRAYLVAATGFGLLAAGLMALRILLDGEPWHARTFWIIAISGFGGLVGAPITLGVIGFFRRRIGNLTPLGNPTLAQERSGDVSPPKSNLGGAMLAMLTGLVFGMAWLGASAALFVFHNRVLAGQYEIHEERPILGFIFSSLQTLGLYLFSIPRYALPWVLPMMMLAAAIALPRLLRALEKPPAKVEQAPPLV